MGNRIDKSKAFQRYNDVSDEGFVELPKKISNVRLERVLALGRGECTYCFPHGVEAVNSRHRKDLRCWKRYRKTQYRVGK